MTRRPSCVLPLIAGLLLSTPVHAEPIFSYTFGQSSYSVSVGGTVDVTVYLQETDDFLHGSLPNGYLSTTGLFGAGVLLDYTGQPAGVVHSADVTPNLAFLLDSTASFFTSATGGQAVLVENAGLGAFVTASGSGPFYEIELGEFQLTGLFPGSATILAAVTGSGGDLVGGDGAVLDPLTTSASAQITVAGTVVPSIPEPSTLGMLIMGLVALLPVTRIRNFFPSLRG